MQCYRLGVENYNRFKNETFNALIVRLAMEFDQFGEEDRDGLLVRSNSNGLIRSTIDSRKRKRE